MRTIYLPVKGSPSDKIPSDSQMPTLVTKDASLAKPKVGTQLWQIIFAVQLNENVPIYASLGIKQKLHFVIAHSPRSFSTLPVVKYPLPPLCFTLYASRSTLPFHNHWLTYLTQSNSSPTSTQALYSYRTRCSKGSAVKAASIEQPKHMSLFFSSTCVSHQSWWQPCGLMKHTRGGGKRTNTSARSMAFSGETEKRDGGGTGQEVLCFFLSKLAIILTV